MHIEWSGRSLNIFFMALLHVQVFSRAELEVVADLCRRYDVMCVSDEVYEWLVYSGHEHVRIGMLNVLMSGIATYM